MNKEYLKAWSFIKDQIPNFTFSHLVEEMRENSNTVDNALQRLNIIDNTKANEAIRCLSFLKDEAINDIACFKNSATTKTLYQLYFANFDNIEQALQKAQKQEKENAEYKNIEENIGCPFKVIEHLINMIQFFFEKDGKMYMIDDYDIKNNTINFKSGTRLPDYKFCRMNYEVPFTLYGKMFWLKEDKSE
jgi:hypothetical protein